MERKLRFGDYPVLDTFFGFISQADDFDKEIRLIIKLLGVLHSTHLLEAVNHLLDGGYTEDDLFHYLKLEAHAPIRYEVTARENLEEYREDILSAINEVF